MDTQERLTRLENMVSDLAMMTLDANPAPALSNTIPAASNAANRFLEAQAAISAERAGGSS